MLPHFDDGETGAKRSSKLPRIRLEGTSPAGPRPCSPPALCFPTSQPTVCFLFSGLGGNMGFLETLPCGPLELNQSKGQGPCGPQTLPTLASMQWDQRGPQVHWPPEGRAPSSQASVPGTEQGLAAEDAPSTSGSTSGSHLDNWLPKQGPSRKLWVPRALLPRVF